MAQTPPAFTALAGSYLAAIVADGETTMAFQQRGQFHACYEKTNPVLYGEYPSRARFYAVSLAIAIPTILVSRKLATNHHKLVKAAGYGLLSWEVTNRAMAAFHNSRLVCQ